MANCGSPSSLEMFLPPVEEEQQTKACHMTASKVPPFALPLLAIAVNGEHEKHQNSVSGETLHSVLVYSSPAVTCLLFLCGKSPEKEPGDTSRLCTSSCRVLALPPPLALQPPLPPPPHPHTHTIQKYLPTFSSIMLSSNS